MYGLIGEKLGHSFSKEIHQKLANYDYRLIELNKDEFKKFMTTREFEGINVTIPYKEAVIPYLDELDTNAEKIGAVNTVIKKNNKLIGYNTDFDGLIYLLKTNNIEIKNKTVMILGTGGTSKTISAVCGELGAAMIYKVSRNGGMYFSYEQAETLDDVQVIFNASPKGMYPDNYAMPFNITVFPKLESVVDVVYNPLNTNLVLLAAAQGLNTVGGLEMLVAQAKKAAEIFTGTERDDKINSEIYLEFCRRLQNIVLIGMPCSGKSTVGKALAAKLNMPFIDTDEEIIRQIGKSIPDIFAEDGEKAFRETETEVIRKTAAGNGQVIATGGGIVKDMRNIQALQQNGILVFLDRALEKMITDDNRPLAKSKQDLATLFEERYDIYDKYCDYKVSNNNTSEAAVNEILSVIRGE